MKLTSTAFNDNEHIPSVYTCQGRDVNPPFHIEDLPVGTASLVLIMDDPDAPHGTWDHWILWNIRPGEDISESSIPRGAVVGKNSWGKNNYGGPCPPSGTHRYFFKLYALSTALDLLPSAGKKDVETAMEGFILAQSQLIGLYEKLS